MMTLPNAVTLANLLCGTLGIVSMVSLPSGRALEVSFVLMIAAAVFDFLDGFVARLTRQYSEVGRQLDSLADMVSFGVLPTLVAMKVYYLLGGYGAWGAVMLILAACAALRLAKFNVSDDQTTEFEGLPTPACALLVGSVGWTLSRMLPVAVAGYAQWTVLAAVVVLALLMVSRIRMFSLKFDGFGFGRNAVRYVFLIVALVMVLIFGMTGIGTAILLYILYSILIWLFRCLLYRSHAAHGGDR